MLPVKPPAGPLHTICVQLHYFQRGISLGILVPSHLNLKPALFNCFQKQIECQCSWILVVNPGQGGLADVSDGFERQPHVKCITSCVFWRLPEMQPCHAK